MVSEFQVQVEIFSNISFPTLTEELLQLSELIKVVQIL